MTRLAVREQKATPKVTQKAQEFEFGDDFQEAGVISKPRKKTKSSNNVLGFANNSKPTIKTSQNIAHETKTGPHVLNTANKQEIDLMAGFVA